MTPAGIGYPSTSTVPVAAPRESTTAGISRERILENAEMERAAARILINGGTKADVADYFYRGYGVKLPGYVPEVDTPGHVRGLSMNAMQGVTFGFGDEAIGSMLGLLTGDSAQGGRDEYRAELQKYNEDNFWKGLGAEVGGAAMVTAGSRAGPAIARRMAGQGLGGRAATGMGVGAGSGAAFGAGSAEGGLSERTKGAIVGTVIGAAAGGVIPVTAAAVGSVVKPLARVGLSWLDKLRNTPQDATTASKAAREHWAQAIVRDHGSIDNAVQKVQKMQHNAPFVLADVAGENGLQLVQAAAGLRGPGKQKMVEDLLTRQADQGDRILGKLFRSLKLGAENAYDAADDMMANRKAFADPLYQQAYTQETKITPALQKILNHPRFQKAYEYGRLIASDEDLAGIANQGALKVPPLSVDKAGKVVATTIPVRALDYMKRGLDAIIDQAGKTGNEPLDKQSSRALRKLLNDALDAVDDVPDYARARGVWRGETEALEALQLGKGGAPLSAGTDVRSPRFMHKPPEVIKRELASLAPAEQELYKLGVAQDVAEFLVETTATAPNSAKKLGGRLYGEAMSNVEKRVRAIFGSDEAADEFMDYVKAEARISQTTSVLGGSRTAPLQQAMAELAGSGPHKGGILRQAADATITAVTQRAKTGWTDAISDEISSMALKGTRGKDELIAVLNSLRPHAPRRSVAPTVVAGQQSGKVR